MVLAALRICVGLVVCGFEIGFGLVCRTVLFVIGALMGGC